MLQAHTDQVVAAARDAAIAAARGVVSGPPMPSPPGQDQPPPPTLSCSGGGEAARTSQPRGSVAAAAPSRLNDAEDDTDGGPHEDDDTVNDTDDAEVADPTAQAWVPRALAASAKAAYYAIPPSEYGRWRPFRVRDAHTDDLKDKDLKTQLHEYRALYPGLAYTELAAAGLRVVETSAEAQSVQACLDAGLALLRRRYSYLVLAAVDGVRMAAAAADVTDTDRTRLPDPAMDELANLLRRKKASAMMNSVVYGSRDARPSDKANRVDRDLASLLPRSDSRHESTSARGGRRRGRGRGRGQSNGGDGTQRQSGPPAPQPAGPSGQSS